MVNLVPEAFTDFANLMQCWRYLHSLETALVDQRDLIQQGYNPCPILPLGHVDILFAMLLGILFKESSRYLKAPLRPRSASYKTIPMTLFLCVFYEGSSLRGCNDSTRMIYQLLFIKSSYGHFSFTPQYPHVLSVPGRTRGGGLATDKKGFIVQKILRVG
jgi:hypothetical protein